MEREVNSAVHGLWQFEEDFLEEGTRATCFCGWKSELQVDPNKATERLKARRAWEAHNKEERRASEITKPLRIPEYKETIDGGMYYDSDDTTDYKIQGK